MTGGMSDTRIKWVDEVKVIACVLVVLGHFFQSMTNSGILPANDLYRWFNQTIYYFHVSLFFICSGYLYQMYSRVDDLRSWSRSVVKKALSLGVPYLTFSAVTWVFKTLLSSDVNDTVGGLGDTLFLHPVSPYWYLYCLFFLFLVIPTFQSTRAAGIALAIAMIAKALTWTGLDIGVYAISSVCANAIMFILGMCIVCYRVTLANKGTQAGICGILFLLLSVIVYCTGIVAKPVLFVLGLMACLSIVVLTAVYADILNQSALIRMLGRYTLPIYLMHTLFAAPVRIVLLRIGISNSIVHVVVGLTASIAGPIVAAMVMRRLRYPEFVLYPGRFIKI